MNTPKLVSLGLVTLAIAQFTGCAMVKKSASVTPATGAPAATVAASVSDVVHINSSPAGATVSINGNDAGVTPLDVTLDRSQTYILAIKQSGYYYYSRILRSEVTSSGTETAKAGLMTATPARFPANISVDLSPVKDRFHALEVAVSKLDSQLAAKQISSEAYKQQLAEVTGFYR